MSPNRHPSTKTWLMFHIMTPLAPFILGGVIRFATTSLRFSWTTFRASELAISLGLLTVFVSQSLLNTQRLLDNDDKREEAAGQAQIFMFGSAIFFIFFGVITAFDVAICELQLKVLTGPLKIFEVLVFSLSVPVLIYAVCTQRSFRLRAI